MIKDIRKPDIRFPGFEDDWEQRKFKDTVKIERGGSPRPIDQFITNDENGLNWIKIGDAPQTGYYITSCSEKIKPEGLSKTREVVPGDLILSNSMSFGRPYIMAINGCIHDGWLLIRNEKGIFNLKFLCLLLGTEQMLSQYRSLAAGSAVNNLNKDLVGGTTVKFPDLEEQRIIGEFFEKVEQTITLHQRKLDDLKELKSGLMQKMFPQKGENIPQVRFPGFTGDWEQRKFGDFLEQTIDYVDPSIENVPLWSLTVEAGLTPKTERYERNFLVKKNDKFKRVKPKEFVFNPMNMTLGAIGYNSGDEIAVSGYYVTMTADETVDDNFLLGFMKSGGAINLYKNFATGSLIEKQRVQYTTLSEIPVKLPSIEEQKQIGQLFTSIDQTITLHQQKIDDLNQLKNGLLQKMFP